MQFVIFSLIYLFLNEFLIQPTTCAIPTDMQNFDPDDITSLWNQFPSTIDKIKEAVNRLGCPKGWKRLGGSCYYLSNLTSTSTEANHTCHRLHSNHSNLMKIRNTVELFYAAHVLSRRNLFALMIDIDPSLLKGRKISAILTDDQGQWKRMKEKFPEARVKYQKLKRKIVERFNSADLRILRRSKKTRESFKKHKQDFIHNKNNSNEYDQEHDTTKLVFSNETIQNISTIDNDDNDYEYDDLDSPDESDKFEQIDDIRGICDQIHWNALHNDSTIYILTTYIISNKTICSLTDVENDTEYDHVCEYVLDYCFANNICGKPGYCVNTLVGFKCACTFLYSGLFCEAISPNGLQTLIGIAITIVLFVILSYKNVQSILLSIYKILAYICRKCYKARPGQHNHICGKNEKEYQKPRILNQIDPTLVRRILVAVLTITIFSFLFITIILNYYNLIEFDPVDKPKLQLFINNTIRTSKQCEYITDYRLGNLIFLLIAFVLTAIFSWLIRRKKLYQNMGDENIRPYFIPPIEPFRTENRFTAATVFGILTYEVLNIFEELLFSTGQQSNRGVLFDLFVRITMVTFVGFRYYPVLASLQLHNILARFSACLYIIGDIALTIVREGSCMGFLQLSRQYSAAEQAASWMKYGSWLLVYGIIKYTPHFILLSYISAELLVRFGYDSIYTPVKKHQSIWSAPVVQLDESEFAKYYVTKLFRRNHRSRQTRNTTNEENNNTVNLDDSTHESELQNNANQSHVKRFFDYIYHWDDDFRFTTMATCTYTVAIVFLYYLTCTFIFLYVSRTTGHISFLRSYVEATLDVELEGTSFLRFEIILSAIFTVIIFSIQLFAGLKYYKRHKLQIYKGIFMEIPSNKSFDPATMVVNSVNYSGFLVGYMAWGFVICFHMIFFVLATIRILTLHIPNANLVFTIVVPGLVFYLLKTLSMSLAGEHLLVHKSDKTRGNHKLKRGEIYSTFLYFSFFADCFLGITSCIIRIIKTTLINILYMIRLDYNFLGKPLEKLNYGFAVYVSYLHIEAAHTHPVMLAFCYSLFDAIHKRPRKYLDEDPCLRLRTPNNNGKIGERRANQLIQGGTNGNDDATHNNNHDIDRSQSKRTLKTAKHRENNALSSRSRNADADEEDRPERALMLKTKSQNPRVPFNADSQNSDGRRTKQRKLNTGNKKKKNCPSNITRCDSQHQPSKLTTVPTLQHLISEHQSDSDSLLYDNIRPMVTEMPAYVRNTKLDTTTHDYHYDNISVKEECVTRTTTTNSFHSTYRESHQNNSGLTQTMSYQTAQQTTVSVVSPRQNTSTLFVGCNNIDSGNNHCSEITNDRSPSSVSNPLYSEVGTSQSLSTHLKRRQSCEITALSMEQPSEEDRKRKIKRRQVARNRWFLAYTIIHTPYLFDLRKNIQSRLLVVRSETKILINKDQLKAILTDQEQPSTTTATAETETLKMRALRNSVAASCERRPPPVPRLMSVPVSVFDTYPQRGAERYIAIRSRMLYDTNAEQSDTQYNVSEGNQQENLTQPSQRVSVLNQPTDDYPLAAPPSNTNSSTFCTQMSLDQCMQIWYEGEARNIQEKRRYGYVYGLRPQSSVSDKVSTATILTPQSPSVPTNDPNPLTTNT